MGASLIQPYYVKDEGVICCKLLYISLMPLAPLQRFALESTNLAKLIYNKALAKSVPAAAVIQMGQVLFGIIGRKGYVGGFFWYVVTSFFKKNHSSVIRKLEFDRGKWNFEWRNKIHRYSKEHRKRM